MMVKIYYDQSDICTVSYLFIYSWVTLSCFLFYNNCIFPPPLFIILPSVHLILLIGFIRFRESVHFYNPKRFLMLTQSLYFAGCSNKDEDTDGAKLTDALSPLNFVHSLQIPLVQHFVPFSPHYSVHYFFFEVSSISPRSIIHISFCCVIAMGTVCQHVLIPVRHIWTLWPHFCTCKALRSS